MKNLVKFSFLAFTAFLFSACGEDGLSTSEVNKLVAGPNSIKGTISGTTLSDSAFSIDYDYHFTTTDDNSYSEGWAEGNNQVVYVEQFFFFDRNGASDYGDQWSSSGRYMFIEFDFNSKTMETLNAYYSEGLWSSPLANGTSFVYGLEYNDSNNSGTMEVTNLKYNEKTQILTGTLNISLPADHTQNSWWDNYNALEIDGDFKIYVPKDNFKVTKDNGNYGHVYRRGK